MGSNLDFLIHVFFFFGDARLSQCTNFCLVSGSYWKNPSFITSNNISEAAWIIFIVFQGVRTNSHKILLLLRSEEFWYFLHKFFLCQDFHIKYAWQFLYPIFLFYQFLKYSGDNLLKKFERQFEHSHVFRSGRVTGLWIIIFSFLFKSLKSLKRH